MTKVYNPQTDPPAYEHRPRYADWKAKKAEGDLFERRVLKFLKDEGKKVFNGLDMFIYQGQKSFYLWNKINPEIDQNLIELLLSKLK